MQLSDHDEVPVAPRVSHLELPAELHVLIAGAKPGGPRNRECHFGSQIVEKGEVTNQRLGQKDQSVRIEQAQVGEIYDPRIPHELVYEDRGLIHGELTLYERAGVAGGQRQRSTDPALYVRPLHGLEAVQLEL